MKERKVYLDGRLVRESQARVPVTDRGFTLGDGVFETMRAIGGRLFRAGEHFDRLAYSASTLGLELPIDLPEMQRAARALLETNGTAGALVRITITRGVPADRGLLPSGSSPATVVMVATPVPRGPNERSDWGYRAVVSGIRRNETSPLSRIKSCNYLDSVLARMEAARAGAQEAILLNGVGDVACGASSNVFLVEGDLLVTPYLDAGVLAGVTRRTVLELCERAGVRHEERRVGLEELMTADALFVTNTAIGVMPVVTLDGRPIASAATGQVTARLRALYEEVLQGGDDFPGVE